MSSKDSMSEQASNAVVAVVSLYTSILARQERSIQEERSRGDFLQVRCADLEKELKRIQVMPTLMGSLSMEETLDLVRAAYAPQDAPREQEAAQVLVGERPRSGAEVRGRDAQGDEAPGGVGQVQAQVQEGTGLSGLRAGEGEGVTEDTRVSSPSAWELHADPAWK
jgi:hypothetical protein